MMKRFFGCVLVGIGMVVTGCGVQIWLNVNPLTGERF